MTDGGRSAGRLDPAERGVEPMEAHTAGPKEPVVAGESAGVAVRPGAIVQEHPVAVLAARVIWPLASPLDEDGAEGLWHLLSVDLPRDVAQGPSVRSQ